MGALTLVHIDVHGAQLDTIKSQQDSLLLAQQAQNGLISQTRELAQAALIQARNQEQLVKAVNYSNTVNSSMWNMIQNHTRRDGYLTQVVQEKMISNFMGQSFNFGSNFGAMGSLNEERVQESSRGGSPQRSAGGDPPHTGQDGFGNSFDALPENGRASSLGPSAAPHIPPTGCTSTFNHAPPAPPALTVGPGDKMRTSEGQSVTVLYVDASSNTAMVQGSDRNTTPVLKQINDLWK